MIASLSHLKFSFPWRNYQSRLLKNFDNHIADNHFHVVAPPGSGKTILGIEIIRRLGKKTFVLAPTLTVRNQWESRLQSFFTKENDYKAFSFDLKNPKDVTFTTYQSLHAFYKTFEDKKDYYAFFKEQGIETLVLDEAHHLKSEWWNCLMELKNNRPFYIVALTATPPYDSSRAEVAKYFTLCGDIDDEIAVPELVKETDLCPHQDFVYLCKPEDFEINFIFEFRCKIADFKDNLLKDKTFISFIKKHRFFKSPNWHLEELYNNTEYFSSILIFLNACGVNIEQSKLEVLGFNKNETIQFPELTLDWLEILFQNLIVKDREQLLIDEQYLLSFEKILRCLNVFEKKKVNFIGEELLYKSLSNSPSKLKSIISIVKAERESLNEDLRCVILTDYIRKEFLNTEENNIQAINKIGVVPIFQYLRNYTNKESIAVLSGSLVIIHKSILKAFNKIVDSSHFSLEPIQIDDDFIKITTKKKTNKGIVGVITKLFEDGNIKVLVGTKSMLGEGWDAPSINTLILASFIGSFVSSNQMRGRAIRKDASKLNKTGNIWHLACLDNTVLNGGRDLDTLRRRFEAFVGVSNNKVSFIENGFDRLEIPEQILANNIELLNNETLKLAKNRKVTANKWRHAVGKGGKVSKEVKIFHLGDKPFKKQKQVYYFDAVKFLVAELSFAIMLFYLEFVLQSFHLVLQRGVLYFIYVLGGGFLATFGYKLYNAIKLFFKHGYLYKKIEKLGIVVIDTLYELGYMTTPKSEVYVDSELINNGDVICSLKDANLYENSLFSTALSELVDPIESPRYLIVKTNFFRKQLNIENFYPVPEIFGDKKENVLVFQKCWSRVFGQNKLFYTRQIEGRKLLLKARLFHVYNAFRKVSKEVVVWK